jgi:hypothetical protein
VRETLDFAARCQGVGTKAEELRRVADLESELGIVPRPEIEAFMKVPCRFYDRSHTSCIRAFQQRQPTWQCVLIHIQPAQTRDEPMPSCMNRQRHRSAAGIQSEQS